jgi:putative ABC transport system ATP-binding protein
MSTPPLVAIENARFRYTRLRHSTRDSFALRCDELLVDEGERVALHGPSGCGKSTLLNLIAGVLRAESGRVRVAGLDLTEANERMRRAHRIRTMGFVFQDFPLVEHLDTRENVLLPYRLNRALELDAGARRRADELLGELGIASLAGARASRLSQGERQRVAIARSLVTNPALLLADEPTAGLDPERASSVCELLEDLADTRGMALVLVTHDPLLLERFPRRINVSSMSEARDEAPA